MIDILENYNYYRDRKNIEKKEKYKEKTNHLTKESREKIYDYYNCDYCGDEIIIKTKRCEMTGGIVTIPYSLTGKSPINLMLCNKCLNPLLEELEEERSGKNHIPRID